jgi:hypothetical protein
MEEKHLCPFDIRKFLLVGVGRTGLTTHLQKAHALPT